MKGTDSAITFKMRKIAELLPYMNNSRTHSEEQIRKIADSIQEFGFLNPVIVDGNSGIIAGHGRIMGAELLGMEQVPTVEASHLTPEQKRAYIIADNKLALEAGWDNEILRVELNELIEAGFDFELTGFTQKELDALTPKVLEGGLVPDDAIPEAGAPVTVLGDVWILGKHRVMCGDSTFADDVEKLMNNQVAVTLHADPPYGLGKESDGVQNDNLYREKLDEFQVDWFACWLPCIDGKASVYIWGYPLDLWRLWHSKIAGAFDVMFKNNIVWNKRLIAGKRSPDLTKYPIASEHCLFFVLGWQHFGNINTADFYEGWEPVRSYLADQADRAGLKPKTIQKLCGVQMYSHWFSKCQWAMIPEVHYRTLAENYPGQFARDWKELKALHDAAQAKYREMVDGSRTYFDNTHDSMWDVWDCNPVTGDDRHGHATPKPIEIMERIMLSSVPPGGLVAEPFAGSGSTLIAAEKTGRVCYTMELTPAYCDVVVKRWQAYTGGTAIHADGGSFDELARARHDSGSV